MEDIKKEHPKDKPRFHPRSLHRERYDFKKLIKAHPELEGFVNPNKYGDESVDFFDPQAVRALNTALLKHFYFIKYWAIPSEYLCPPIPGRSDYIHHIADLLAGSNFGRIPRGDKIKCLDIGVGASCIYPIIANKLYGWASIGSEIDPVALESAKNIIDKNPNLKGKVELRLQTNSKDIYYGMIKHEEKFDLSVCNPPFHSSAKEAEAESLRKLTNLKKTKPDKTVLNFGGKSHELWCEGGESRFIRKMIRESKKFGDSCFWFSTLVSKQTHLKSAYITLKETKATKVKTIPMGQGQKSSRILAWTFLTKEQQADWRKRKWELKKISPAPDPPTTE